MHQFVTCVVKCLFSIAIPIIRKSLLYNQFSGEKLLGGEGLLSNTGRGLSKLSASKICHVVYLEFTEWQYRIYITTGSTVF